MNKQIESHYFLFFALAASLVVVFFIAKPFLAPLILAAVFAFLFQPVYLNILSFFGQRESLSAFLTTVLALMLVLLPLTLLGAQIFKESNQLFYSLQTDGTFLDSIKNGIDQIRSSLSIPPEFEMDLGQYATKALQVLIQNFGAIFSSFAKFLLNSFVFLIAFYFFLKDGNTLKEYIISLSPLDQSDDNSIVARVKNSVSATVKGSLAISCIQGVLSGIGFAIFGVPHPALWGGVTAISALIPGIGTALIISPAVLFLYFAGNTVGGLGLLIWGVTAVGLIDNFLGPKLIGRGMKLHPLAVFVSVLGGLSFFGPIGFLLGPLTMSVCLAFIDMYISLRKRENQAA